MRSYAVACYLLGTLSLLTAAGGVAPVSARSGYGSLELDVRGFRSADGQALVAVFRGEEGFPNKIEHAAFHKAYRLKDRRLKVVLRGLPAGPLAVAIQHDEDCDFKMDTGVFGIPREGFGTSRDAKARFGPPDYEDARIVLRDGRTQKLRIHIRYF